MYFFLFQNIKIPNFERFFSISMSLLNLLGQRKESMEFNRSFKHIDSRCLVWENGCRIFLVEFDRINACKCAYSRSRRRDKAI
jgi:hypothetical protein